MTWFTGLDLLDAQGLHRNMALRVEGDRLAERVPYDGQPGTDLSRDGARALVTPGLVDLQVNGGAGRMLGDCSDPAHLHAMADAHWATGTVAILPTLISDGPDQTWRVIDLVARAQRTNPALLGLHLEGPHLAVAGAHDAAMLRPLSDADLALYTEARARLGVLLITLAPEIVPPAQIRALSAAGIIVALGHTACDYDTAMAAYDAGAVMATHLFNAMSGLHHRNPGLVGATLDRGKPFGLIADGIHVNPAALRLALRASPDQAVLVSDAMALTGSDQDRFILAGRTAYRRTGRLELADGTLAGADLTLVAAVENLCRWTGQDIAALAPLAFGAPAQLLAGHALAPSELARFVIWHGDRAEARIDGAAIKPLARR
jgi:N-acetylglucosamine-6-phosphate deacetylase